MLGFAPWQILVLVLGEGVLIRHGGGNGSTLGSILVAHFGTSGDFLSPTLTTDGGGNSSEGTTNETDVTNAANHDSTYTELAGLTPKRVSVSIGVPTTYFEKIWEQRNPPADGSTS